MEFQEKNQDEIEKLEQQLYTLRLEAPSPIARLRMKKNILSAIESDFSMAHFGFEFLISSIGKIAREVVPGIHFKAMLKERILGGKLAWLDRIALFFSARRKVWAGSLIALLLISLIFNFSLNIERAEAQFLTTVEETFGHVVVVRGKKVIPAAPRFMLKADDFIQTGAGSFVVIRFLDQSVTRLDENSEVKISKLFIDPENTASTIVEVILFKGRLWARVVNLIDNASHFLVQAQNTTAVARNRAAFDVKISDDQIHAPKVTVSAIQNNVDVKVSTRKKVIETTLTKGFSAEAPLNAERAPTIEPVSGSDAAPNVGESQWIRQNLVKDGVYIEELKEEQKQQRAESVSPLPQSVSTIQSQSKIALTFDDFHQQLKQLDAAIEKLPRAERLIEKGQKKKATILLIQFQRQFQQALDWIQKYELQEPVRAMALKQKMDRVLEMFEKDLALLLPDDAAYDLKRVVVETQAQIATDWLERAQKHLHVAHVILEEASELLEKGDKVRAREQVAEYSRVISNVANEVHEIPDDAKASVVPIVLENKTEGLKTLQAISLPEAGHPLVGVPVDIHNSALSVSGSSTASIIVPRSAERVEQDLIRSVSEAKANTLEKIGEVVLEAQRIGESEAYMKKITDAEINGKPVLNLRVSPNSITVRSGDEVTQLNVYDQSNQFNGSFLRSGK